MRNRKLFIILIPCFVAAFVLTGITLAYMFRKTQAIDNDFTPAYVTCETEEQFDGTTKTEVKVRNTSNIPAYLRVKLVSYWTNPSGNVEARMASVPTFNLNENWVYVGDDTYCYKMPIDPNQLTDDLLADGAQIVLDEQEGFAHNLVILAEAIQSLPKNVVEDKWQVVLDSNDYIVSAR